MSWNTNSGENKDKSVGDMIGKIAEEVAKSKNRECMIVASAFKVLLWGVRNVGLEKTLEDMRNSIPALPDPDMEIYTALLSFASKSKAIWKEDTGD